MELAYAGLHQLCVPMLARLDQLPKPQRDALAVAFGMREGQVPDRFLVSLAVLNLLAATAEDQPLACLVDDAQWLDRASVQCLAFAARRLLAEPIALIFAARQEIAAKLFITPRTVEWHLDNVFTKLGITSRKDLR